MLINPTKELILPLGVQIGMKGFIRVQLINKFSGKCRWDSGFFPNKILDSGRNIMATQTSWISYCHVGTDNTTPAAVQTGLLGRVAYTNTIRSTVTGTSTSPYFGWKRRTFRIPVGAGQGGQNLSEAGIGYGSAVNNLISRALIIDPITQAPTTVTPLADELVDVTYELRYYPPLVDVTQSVVMDSVTYDTVTRAAEVTNATTWAVDIGNKIGEACTTVSDFRAYNGALGAITTNPSGLTANLASTSEVFNKAYSNNSYLIGIQANFPPASFNVSGGGFRSVSIRTTAGSYQTSFTSNPGGNMVPKTNLKTMILVWDVSWVEGTI